MFSISNTAQLAQLPRCNDEDLRTKFKNGEFFVGPIGHFSVGLATLDSSKLQLKFLKNPDFIFFTFLQISSAESMSYVGAVVEFHPIYDNDGQKAAEANANHYQTIIKRAAQNVKYFS